MIEVGDVLFVDTNVLLTATDELRAHHHDARHILAGAAGKGFHLAVSGQILREYLVVATRPSDRNGLGLCSEDALRNVEAFLKHVVIYDETEAVSRRLRELVRTGALAGARIHDANVAATMLTHGLTKILTQNALDFDGLPGIVTLDLSDAAGTVSPTSATRGGKRLFGVSFHRQPVDSQRGCCEKTL
jgi:predicted nucleic acid-binding protein